MNKGVVIVGAGHAGVSLAAALRAQEYPGTITLLSDEGTYPYHRPPLSKAFICSDSIDDEKKLLLEQHDFYDEKQIDLHLGVCVSAIDTAMQSVVLGTGEALAYEYLILATGARARTLLLPGSELQGVETLRTLEDAKRIRQSLNNSQAVVIVGGGFIGLELAVTARQLGKQVTVLETCTRIMERSVAPEVSEYVTQKHRSKGINIELNACVDAFIGERGHVVGVCCSSDERAADLVIVGAGAIANSELAQAAGIECANGILVNAQLRTSVPNIFAIGDCACHEHVHAGGARLRLESIQNANDQARLVAQVICGSAAHYQALPWFWSDQGDVKLQMVGLSIGRTDCVTRGDPSQGRFSVFHYRDQTLIAVDSINQPLEHIQSRKLMAAGISPDKTQIADPSQDLKALLS